MRNYNMPPGSGRTSSGTVVLECDNGHRWERWADFELGGVFIEGDDEFCPECDGIGKCI